MNTSALNIFIIAKWFKKQFCLKSLAFNDQHLQNKTIIKKIISAKLKVYFGFYTYAQCI